MDIHSQILLGEYNDQLPQLKRLSTVVVSILQDALTQNNMQVTSITSRVKTEESLKGKLLLKGAKYSDINDITDLVGARIVTFYTDDVDRIAAIIEQLFTIDWDNSIDKRKIHKLDSFGYNSLHYVCTIPQDVFFDPQQTQLNNLKFELQIRTTLQHAWATLNHDTGYKTGVDVPPEYLRSINRLAGLLELADDEMSRIRTEINTYRHKVQTLVQNGQLSQVMLDGDTFNSYLQMRPFDKLNRKIAAINQAEIAEVPLNDYLTILKQFGCKTLEDIEQFRKQNQDDAYLLARHQIGNTDLDIVASSIGLQNLCIVQILKQGAGKIGLKYLFDTINGESSQNMILAELTIKQAQNLPFFNQQ